MSADPSLSDRPKYDQLIELLDTLVNWQKFGAFLPGIKSEHIQVLNMTIEEMTNKKLLFSQNGSVFVQRLFGWMSCQHYKSHKN